LAFFVRRCGVTEQVAFLRAAHKVKRPKASIIRMGMDAHSGRRRRGGARMAEGRWRRATKIGYIHRGRRKTARYCFLKKKIFLFFLVY
jgi:hypothetical protein